jgi:hypothetical protein
MRGAVKRRSLLSARLGRAQRGALGVALGGLGTIVSLASCNLVFGIEEQGTRSLEDANDASDDSAEAGRPALEKCKRDADCIAPNTCFTPHCDTVLGACTYALCEAKGRTCAAGVCNTATFACSDPQPYSFITTRYDVPNVTSGCGPSPNDCVAAAFPFVFIGTRDDVVALRGDDLVATTPTKVAISDLTVRPAQLLVSGRRLWVLGAVQGQVPPYRLPIASIDVPSDPTVASLHAQTLVLTYPYPTARAFAAPNGGVYVTYDDAPSGFPTAALAGPLPANTNLVAAMDGGSPPPGAVVMTRVTGAPGNGTIVASSGSRLVVHRYPSTFNIVASPGTEAAATQPDLPLQPALVAYGPITFAVGSDGTMVMSGAVNADVPMPDCNCTSHVRLQWVFPNAIATTTDTGVFLDPEGYTNPFSGMSPACRVCMGDYFGPRALATWIDRRSVLIAAPYSGQGPNRSITDVRVLARDPSEANEKRRAQTKATDSPHGDFATDRIALTSANGIGYLVIADGQGNDVSLSVVDPRCDAK